MGVGEKSAELGSWRVGEAGTLLGKRIAFDLLPQSQHLGVALYGSCMGQSRALC